MKTPAHTRIKIAVYTLLVCATPLQAADMSKDDMAHAQNLVQENCTACHGDEMYTRENHFVKSRKALELQVQRCKNNTGTSWFDEDTDGVVNYLNTRYYKF